MERVGIESLFFHEQDLDRAVAYLYNHILLTSAEPKHYKEKFCILREHLSLSLVRAFESTQFGANVKLAKKSLENLAKFMGKKDFLKLVWKMLHRDYTLYHQSVNVSLMGMAFMGFLENRLLP